LRRRAAIGDRFLLRSQSCSGQRRQACRAEDEDLESGTIYVLRSKSEHPEIAAHRELIHKIVAAYSLFNINRTRLENILHRVFSAARLDLTIKDRFGQPVKPKEWFLVPLYVIDAVVDKIRDGSIVAFEYDPASASLKRIDSVGNRP
jgi:hypothetical protein